MTKFEDSRMGGVARTAESRVCERRKLASMAYVELGQENGGILLNVGEGGLAVQTALALKSQEFSRIRFQLPNVRGWLAAKGRIAWTSSSRTAAGIQFVEMQPEVREQIRIWVAKEGSAPEAGHEKVNGGDERTPYSAVRANSAGSYGEGARGRNGELAGGGFGNGGNGAAHAEPQGAVLGATVEVAPQPFQFNHYSMFGGDPASASVWVEPVRAQRSWVSLALLGICLAALFFVLGATIGRGKLDQWLASVGLEKQTEGAAQTGRPTEPSAGTSSSGGAENPGDKGGTDQEEAAKQSDYPNGATGGSGTAEGDKSTAPKGEEDGSRQPQSDANADATSLSPNGAAADLPAAGATRPPLRKERTGRPVGAPRTIAGTMGGAENPDTAPRGSAILVNPPAPGSPPLFVNLTNEAVSASEWVAISARRSVNILPRMEKDAMAGPERVTIGKLISHSEPYYPLEAREKRLEGSIDVRATIGRTGEVISVAPVTGPSPLTTAAMTALREWRYEPTLIDGDPVETQVDVTMVFRLQ